MQIDRVYLFCSFNIMHGNEREISQTFINFLINRVESDFIEKEKTPFFQQFFSHIG